MSTTAPTPPRLALTVVEAAQAVSLSERTVRKLIARKEFPAFRVGGRIVCPVNPWLDAQTEAQATDPAKEAA